MTTYAPKFPDTFIKSYGDSPKRGPLTDHIALVIMRNAKVSIGAPLSYHIDKPKTEPKKKNLMCYVSRVSVPELDTIEKKIIT